MKILFSIGHGRLHLLQAASSLARRGITIRLILGWAPKQTDGWFVKVCSKILRHNLSVSLQKRKVADPAYVIHQCPEAEFFLHGLLLLAKLFKGLRGCFSFVGWKCFGWCSRRHIRDADVFHVRSGAGQGGALIRAKKRGMKVLVDHSMAHPGYIEKHLRSVYDSYLETLELGISTPLFRLVAKDCEMADVLLVNSDFVKSTCVEMGLNGDKIRVVSQGVRADFFALRKNRAMPHSHSPQPLRLLFTGNFGFHKGGEYILEAVKMLTEEAGRTVKMDVVGSLYRSDQIIGKYRRFNLPVTFHGPVLQDDLKAFLQNADIYVFPSLAEGCASSGMEAMAAGLCVIATYESGLPITDGETGFIVPAQDAKAIAERIGWLAEHPAEIDRVGANAARLIASQYTWEKYAEKVEAVYRELQTA